MKIPKGWNSVFVDSYIELREFESDGLDSQIEMLSIILDVPEEDIDDLSLRELTEIENQLYWLRSEPSKTVKPKIGDLTYIGFDNITLGEYIELNHFFSEDFISNLPLIASVLFRQTSTNEWGEKVIEPYDYDPHTRKGLFLEIPVTDIYGIINDFLEYKENFEKTYKNLFDEPLEELSEEDKKKLDKEEREAEEDEERQRKWSWERLIYTLCLEDLTKVDDVLNLKLVFVFNMLSMKKDLDI